LRKKKTSRGADDGLKEMPKKKKGATAATLPPASVAVTGIPGPGGAPSVLNGVYLLEEGQEVDGRALRGYTEG